MPDSESKGFWSNALNSASNMFYSARARASNLVNHGPGDFSAGYMSGVSAMFHFPLFQAHQSIRRQGLLRSRLGLTGLGTGLGMTFGGIRNQVGMPATLGYGAALASPLLAGAALYSGLANLRRGRYGFGIGALAVGAGLAGAMIYGRYLDVSRTNAELAAQQNFIDARMGRMEADFDY